MKRMNEELIQPNTCWLTCRWDFELPHREERVEVSLYLWMDAASGYLVGGYLKADRGYWESAGWLESFRRAAERHGIPKKLITDEDEIPENKAGKLLGKRANKLTDAAADFPLWLTWKESTRIDVAGRRDLNEYVEEYLTEWNLKKGFFADKKAKEEAVDWMAALKRFRERMERYGK